VSEKDEIFAPRAATSAFRRKLLDSAAADAYSSKHVVTQPPQQAAIKLERKHELLKEQL
jgi:hypothetical protein